MASKKRRTNAADQLRGLSAEAAQELVNTDGPTTKAEKAKPAKKARSQGKPKAEDPKDTEPMTTLALPRSLLNRIKRHGLNLSDERGSNVLLWQVVAEAMDSFEKQG